MAKPKGSSKTGGRRAGTPNKDKSAVVKAAHDAGLTPRDYLLSIMRDETKEEAVRMKAAESVAKYVHHALAAIQHSGSLNVNASALTDGELEAIARAGRTGAATAANGAAKSH